MTGSAECGPTSAPRRRTDEPDTDTPSPAQRAPVTVVHLRSATLRRCPPAPPRRPGRCRRRSEDSGTYGSTNTAPPPPGSACRTHRPSGPTALLDPRTCWRADWTRTGLFGRTGEIGPQRLENLLRNPRLATGSVAADAMRATVDIGCSGGRRTTIGVSPQPAQAAVASARTDPRLVSGSSVRTTGTPRAVLDTTWCAVQLRGGKTESGGG